MDSGAPCHLIATSKTARALAVAALLNAPRPGPAREASSMYERIRLPSCSILWSVRRMVLESLLT